MCGRGQGKRGEAFPKCGVRSVKFHFCFEFSSCVIIFFHDYKLRLSIWNLSFVLFALCCVLFCSVMNELLVHGE